MIFVFLVASTGLAQVKTEKEVVEKANEYLLSRVGERVMQFIKPVDVFRENLPGKKVHYTILYQFDYSKHIRGMKAPLKVVLDKQLKLLGDIDDKYVVLQCVRDGVSCKFRDRGMAARDARQYFRPDQKIGYPEIMYHTGLKSYVWHFEHVEYHWVKDGNEQKSYRYADVDVITGKIVSHGDKFYSKPYVPDEGNNEE